MVKAGVGPFAATDRDRILQAMVECCAERGFMATTVEQVVARADVRREEFDALYADKEECAIAILNKLLSETLTTVAMAQGGSESLLDGLGRGLLAILKLMAANPGQARLAYIDARQGGTATMHDVYERGALVLSSAMDGMRSLGDGGGAAAPISAARGALGGAEAAIRRELSAGHSERLPALLPDLLYTALVPFVGQREALRQSSRAAELVAEEE